MNRALMLRPLAASAAAATTLLLLAPTAFAHVGVDKDEITAGASTTLSFSFSHGCDGSPTNSLKFQIPEDVFTAKAQVHAGWTIESETETLAAPEEVGHGEEITDRVATITFTAQPGFEVPDDQRDTFTIAFTAPDTEGQQYWKVVQGCESGENAWINEWDGTGEEPDNPAPSVNVVAGAAGEGDHGHDEAEGTTDTTVEVGEHHDEGASDDSGDSDDSSNGLAIAGLVVGGLGLVAGGTALLRTRKSSGA